MDRKGQTKEYSYDNDGNLLEEKDYIGKDSNYNYYRNITYTYDEAGNVLTKETFNFKKHTRVGVLDALISAGDKVTYAYDAAGRVAIVSGPGTKATWNYYNKRGNLVKKVDKVSDGYFNIKRFDYNLLSKPISETVLVEATQVDLSHVGSPVYDSEYLTRVQATTVYTYNKKFEVKTKQDAMGNTTAYEYDLDGHVTKVTDPLGKVSMKTYDLMGNLIEEKNPKRASTYYEYDNLLRLIRKKAPACF